MFGVCGEEVEKQDCIPQTVGIDDAGKARQPLRPLMLQKPPWRREQNSRGRTGIVCLRVKRCGKIKAVTALAMQRTVALCPWAACRKPFSGAAAPSVERMEWFQTARCGRCVPRCDRAAGNWIDCRLSVKGSGTNARSNQWEQFGEKGRGKTLQKPNSRGANNRINCAPG